jgi:uncharacterized protein
MQAATRHAIHTMNSHLPGPTPGSQRLDLLDALRGFALAGVLLANLVAFSLYFFLSHDAAVALPTFPVDRWLDAAIGILVSGKFVTLFSIMFGIGFALQMQRSARGGGWRRYLRRLGVLLGMGLLHSTLLWWGDILRYYALLGLLLLPMAKLRPRTLATIGVLLVILPHLSISAWLASVIPPVPTQEHAFAAALAAFSSHDVGTMLRGNLDFIDWWLPTYWGLVLSISGNMLVGAAIGKSGVLHDPARHALFWKRLSWAFPAGLALALVVKVSDYGRLPAQAAWLDNDIGRMVMRDFNQATALVLALGYAAVFVLLFSRPAWRRWLQHLAPVGRMALSNYLTHSLLGLALFYGVGIGIGPRYGLVGVMVAWVLLFGAQIVVSRWWLARFRFGPAEWAWRSLTYGQRQPMRRRAAMAPAATLDAG